MSHLLDELVRAQKRGERRGQVSICSAHMQVLDVALQGPGPVLIEATCNQVNQFGGYTGMTPTGFTASVKKMALHNHFPAEQLILGGDHLGPSPWQGEPAASAMAKAAEMVRAYVRAGFTKIHLDASMRLGDDPPHTLDARVIASRTAELARVAEQALPNPDDTRRYVVGSEVPLPGGGKVHEGNLKITTVEAARATLEAMQAAFAHLGLQPAWERVIAMVVQPGVEFGDGFVVDYIPEAAQQLAGFIETTPIVYEAHSTDYQSRASLRNLVRDHFSILKVGPALTFAYREAVFALAGIECELIAPGHRSDVVNVIDRAMVQHPEYWRKYYQGNSDEQATARKFSLSDRIRYYWTDSTVQAALKRLLSNLEGMPIPPSLVSQYIPGVSREIQAEGTPISADNIINTSVRNVLDDYRAACTPE